MPKISCQKAGNLFCPNSEHVKETCSLFEICFFFKYISGHVECSSDQSATRFWPTVNQKMESSEKKFELFPLQNLEIFLPKRKMQFRQYFCQKKLGSKKLL